MRAALRFDVNASPLPPAVACPRAVLPVLLPVLQLKQDLNQPRLLITVPSLSQNAGVGEPSLRNIVPFSASSDYSMAVRERVECGHSRLWMWG